jgi:TolB-like protein
MYQGKKGVITMVTSAEKILAIIALLMLCVAPLSAEQAGVRYTTAIFPFEEQGSHIEDYGKRISDELTANLFDTAGIDLIDQDSVRSRLDGAMSFPSKMINLSVANEIAQLTGAKVIVTGMVLESGDSIIIVSRIISTETNRVFMETIRGRRENANLLMDGMVARMMNVINLYLEKLVT